MPNELAETLRVGIEIVVAIVAAVWVVSKIRTTTEMLRTEIRNLGHTVRELKREIERIENRQWEHATRIARLEAGVASPPAAPIQE